MRHDMARIVRAAQIALMTAVMAISWAGGLHAAPSASEWSAWKSAFLMPSGRVVDTGNGGISHSEGQGYGMLLAVEMDDQAAFDAIWTFADEVLRAETDPLMAWRYDPRRADPVADPNNASDGDLLAAYALFRAYRAWGVADYRTEARAIARALSDATLVSWDGVTYFMPARTGFSREDRADGPVINLSYYIFEAFAVMDYLDPGSGWDAQARRGRALIARSLGSGGLPADWLSVPRGLSPASGFEPVFGYNNLRLPLYLARGGLEPRTRSVMARLAERIGDREGRLTIVDTTTGQVRERLDEPGYRAIVALAACLGKTEPFPESARRFETTSYYAATLHLLTLGHVREAHPECLR